METDQFYTSEQRVRRNIMAMRETLQEYGVYKKDRVGTKS